MLSVVGDGLELMAAGGQPGLEGLVAKRLESIYRPGERSKHWVKGEVPRLARVPRAAATE